MEGLFGLMLPEGQDSILFYPNGLSEKGVVYKPESGELNRKNNKQKKAWGGRVKSDLLSTWAHGALGQA